MWAAGALLLLAASCRARLHGPDATAAGLSPAVRQLLQHEEHVRAELVAERDQAVSALHAAEGAGKAAQNEVANLQRQVEAEGSMLREMREELKADEEVKADMDHFQTDSKSQEKVQVANKAMALSRRLYSALKDAKSKLAARDAELREEQARLGEEAAERKSEDLEMEAKVKELHALQAESATRKVTTEAYQHLLRQVSNLTAELQRKEGRGSKAGEAAGAEATLGAAFREVKELIKKLRANESVDKRQLAEAQAKLSATAKELAASKAKLASAETAKQEIRSANTKAAAEEHELGQARAAADKQVEELRRLRAKASQGEKQLQESRAEAAKQAEELGRARQRAEAEEREMREARATVARQAEELRQARAEANASASRQQAKSRGEAASQAAKVPARQAQDLKTTPVKANSEPKLTHATTNGQQKASKAKDSDKQQKQELESAKKQAAKAKWKEELRQAHERTLARARELQAAQAELSEQDLAATEGTASGLSAASAELEAIGDDAQGVEAGSKDGALEELNGAVKATDREIKIAAAVDVELQSHHDAQAALASQAAPTTAATSAAAMEPAAPAAKAVEGAAAASAEVVAEEPGKAKASPKTTSVDDLTLLAFAGGAADASAEADVVDLDTDPLPPPDASEALAP